MLHETVGEPNVMIKIPGTKEGWPAITETTAAGISVNVTLIFGLEQYRNVMEAYVTGLEQAAANGHDLAVENTVNTMPEKTMQAVADHGEVRGDRVRPFYDDAAAHMQALADAGIDYDDVIEVLIKEGVDKFVVAWDELQTTLAASLEAARA